MFDSIKKIMIQSRDRDELLYEYVMTELEEGVIYKGLWAKATAISEGEEKRIKPLYMQYRVQSIKDELTKMQIVYNEMNKDSLFKKIAAVVAEPVTEKEPEVNVTKNSLNSVRSPNEADYILSEIDNDIKKLKRDLGIEGDTKPMSEMDRFFNGPKQDS